MDSGFSRDFRYLDTEAERQELAGDIRRVRQSVIQMAESVPVERHYEPRYHGWSLAAMLAHLTRSTTPPFRRSSSRCWAFARRFRPARSTSSTISPRAFFSAASSRPLFAG